MGIMHSSEEVKENRRINDKKFRSLESRLIEEFDLDGKTVKILSINLAGVFFNGSPTPDELVGKSGYEVNVDDAPLFYALHKLYDKQGGIVYCGK